MCYFHILRGEIVCCSKFIFQHLKIQTSHEKLSTHELGQEFIITLQILLLFSPCLKMKVNDFSCTSALYDCDINTQCFCTVPNT